MKAKQTKSAELIAIAEVKALVDERFDYTVRLIERMARSTARALAHTATKDDLANTRQELLDKIDERIDDLDNKFSGKLLDTESYLASKIDRTNVELHDYVHRTDPRLMTLEVEMGNVKQFVGLNEL